MKKKNQKPELTEAKAKVNVEAKVIKKPADLNKKRPFITVIDEREIKINHQLVLSQALCSLRTYSDYIDDFLEGATRKQIREDYHDINEHQKAVRKFLKKYYWKQA